MSHLLRVLGAAVVTLAALLPQVGAAHPLGNFTVNHFARLKVDGREIETTYVIDMAEIPAFGELRSADTNGDGTTSDAELHAYLARVAGSYVGGLRLTVDGKAETFSVRSERIAKLPGAGGLFTLRLEYDLAANGADAELGRLHRVQFEDINQRDRIGWREIVVTPGTNVNIFNSSAYSNSVSNELRNYPQDMLASPLDEHSANLSWTMGTTPAGAVLLRTRNGQTTTVPRDRFTELINVGRLTPGIALLGILIAAGFGAMHALSPGHGKTVVGAYLVGSRGTPRHAIFLGLAVTITHTAGVFALGLVTLFASRYILPERLFPILSFVSGALVVMIGFSLFARRVRSARAGAHSHSHAEGHVHVHDGKAHAHSHDHAHKHPHSHDHSHDHAHAHTHEHPHTHSHVEAHVHSHGGKAHSHLPPGAEGERIKWRSLLALGISGGLLPCPSALVVLLSAIALHRAGYGLVLVIAFSAGLAATLTGIGLAFVYAGRWLNRFGSMAKVNSMTRVLPALSALVVACLGLGICYQAILQMGINPVSMLHRVL